MQIKIPSFPDWFLSTPAGQQAVADAEAEQKQRRLDLAAELRDTEIELDKAGKVQAKKVRAAVAEHDKARDALKAAYAALMKAKSAAHGATYSLERRRDSLKQQLAEIREPAIEAFAAEMDSELDRLRETNAQTTYKAAYTGLGQPVDVPLATNADAIQRRAVAIKSAAAKAEQLAFQPDVDVQAELSRIRRTLPAVTMEPIAG